jgi:hypothetical protein
VLFKLRNAFSGIINKAGIRRYINGFNIVVIYSKGLKESTVVVMRVTGQEGQSHNSLPVYIEHFVLYSPYNTTLLDTSVCSSTEL